jgi:hypothetical protein
VIREKGSNRPPTTSRPPLTGKSLRPRRGSIGSMLACLTTSTGPTPICPHKYREAQSSLSRTRSLALQARLASRLIWSATKSKFRRNLRKCSV